MRIASIVFLFVTAAVGLAAAQCPTRTFDSGNIAGVTGTIEGNHCAETCTEVVDVVAPKGFDSAEVMITGWKLARLGQAGPLKHLEVGVSVDKYDSVKGILTIRATTNFQAARNVTDEYHFSIFYTAILTKDAGAAVTTVGAGCTSSSGSSCSGPSQTPGVPSGWSVVGGGISRFALTGNVGSSAGVTVNELKVDADDWKMVGSNLQVDTECTLQDATPTEPVDCELDLMAVAAAPGETENPLYGPGGGKFGWWKWPPSTVPVFQAFNGYSAQTAVNGYAAGLQMFDLHFEPGVQADTWAWSAGVDSENFPIPTAYWYTGVGFLGDTKPSIPPAPMPAPFTSTNQNVFTDSQMLGIFATLP